MNERGWNSQEKAKPYEVGKRGEGKGLPQEHQKGGRGEDVTSYRYGTTRTMS
jgi:hypothetical protein